MTTDRIKYPRTYHLPYSQSKTDDDKTLKDDLQFKNMEVVVTIKMDGEDTTIYPDGYVHARSLNGCGYQWQNWIQSKAWEFTSQLDDTTVRIIGENLYAKHSIEYKFDTINDTFQVFAIADPHTFFSWDDITKYCDKAGLKHVEVIYRGIYDEGKILQAFEDKKTQLKNQGQDIEGFVVRNVNAFKYEDFHKNVAKYVRANHVQTDEHWRNNWTKNKINNKDN